MELAHVVRTQYEPFVVRQPFQLLARRIELAGERVDPRRRLGLPAPRPVEDPPGVLRQGGDLSQRLDPPVQIGLAPHVAMDPADAADPPAPGGDLLETRFDLRAGVLRRLEGPLPLLPPVRAQGLPPQISFRLLQLVGGPVILPVARPPSRPERIGFLRKPREAVPQSCRPGPGREDDLADLVLRLQDLPAAFFEPDAVEAEHPLEEGPVRAGQEGIERSLAAGRRQAAGAEEGVLPALAANHFQGGFRVLDPGADPHPGIAVQKVMGRTHGDAEEQVLYRAQRGGLARFVGAEDDMEVGAAGRQLDRTVREVPVAEKIEAPQAHQPSPAISRAER